jgi:hypothetical protein
MTSKPLPETLILNKAPTSISKKYLSLMNLNILDHLLNWLLKKAWYQILKGILKKWRSLLILWLKKWRNNIGLTVTAYWDLNKWNNLKLLSKNRDLLVRLKIILNLKLNISLSCNRCSRLRKLRKR